MKLENTNQLNTENDSSLHKNHETNTLLEHGNVGKRQKIIDNRSAQLIKARN